MTEQEIVASAIGGVLSLLLQFLKRWYTFTPNQVKGLVVLVGTLYAGYVVLSTGQQSVGTFILNIASVIVGNQAFYALILNNTEVGKSVADYK